MLIFHQIKNQLFDKFIFDFVKKTQLSFDSIFVSIYQEASRKGPKIELK